MSEHGLTHTVVTESSLPVAWERFCAELGEKLRAAGREILQVDDPLDRVEGLRVLLRDLRMAIERCVEHADPEYPSFFEVIRETYHLVADTPDYAVYAARIDGSEDYVIEGRVGEADRFTFTTQGATGGTQDAATSTGLLAEGEAQPNEPRPGATVITGVLDDNEMDIDPDGRFRVVLSTCRPDRGNWLPTSPDTTMVIVRNEFHDRYARHRRYAPTKIVIRKVEAPSRPDLLTKDEVVAALAKIGSEVGTLTMGRRRVNSVIQARGVARMSSDQGFWASAGSNPRTFFQDAYWELGRDEAMVVELDQLPEASFWILTLTNAWMESLDFRFHPMSINKHTADVAPDGGLRLVIAARDPGVPNWLDTAGHDHGTMVWRWSDLAAPPPTPRITRMAIEDLTR